MESSGVQGSGQSAVCVGRDVGVAWLGHSRFDDILRVYSDYLHVARDSRVATFADFYGFGCRDPCVSVVPGDESSKFCSGLVVDGFRTCDRGDADSAARNAGGLDSSGACTAGPDGACHESPVPDPVVYQGASCVPHCDRVNSGRRDGAGAAAAVEGVSAAVPGRWAASNRRKKLNRKNRGVPEWRRNAAPVGFCETVASGSSVNSSCPSYGQALSDAERDAKESLARRRAAENALKEKLAKLKLAELEDKKRCAELADLKHQRIIQWTNEATAKSQQSLDKVKSIDPSSSASQYEIRQQAKKLADAESDNRRLCSIVKTLSPDWQELIERKAESTFNTEYVDELMALGEAGRDNGFGY